MILSSLPKQISKDWNLRQPRNSGQRFGLRIVQDSADQARFSISQPNFMFNFLLADDGLADAADARLTHHRGNFHRNLQRYFSIAMDMGRHVDIYADVEVLKLSVY